MPADKLNNGAVYGYLLMGSPTSPEFQGSHGITLLYWGPPIPMHISGVMGMVEVP